MKNPDYAAKAAYHGEVAQSYEAVRQHEPLWELEQTAVRAFVETCAPGSTLLDVPCGTGRFLSFYLSRHLRVQALDISEDMLAVLRAKLPATGAAVTVQQADAERLLLADQSVDHIVSWRFFHLIPLTTADRVLAEMTRVCRGSIYLQVLPVEPRGWVAAVPAVLRALVRPLRQWRSRHGGKPWSHIPSFVHSEQALLAMFARHRLQVAETQTLGNYGGKPVRVYRLVRG